ncbi:MAG: hypothetical protein AB2401_02130 [Bacillus sp. (in: firmicutes)]|uniref:hypothetical protein n=1 Tax=Bacillus marasmi TaxID=1926279 RepID=UPI0011C839FF|nr:hypothetical protein [Bacillus marasmi]
MKAQPGKRLENNEEKVPLFEAPDGKILATGDMFRGPSTGFISDLDLNNPGSKLPSDDIEQQLR